MRRLDFTVESAMRERLDRWRGRLRAGGYLFGRTVRSAILYSRSIGELRTLMLAGQPVVPVILKLAVKNLLHDRLRFTATIVGIVFSMVLVTVQMGLFLSFEKMVTTMIDHAPGGQMAECKPILNARAENQVIGYIEGTEVFDLVDNKRCNYNPSTGNLVEPDSGRIIGHVSLAGYFVGESWIADELFAGRLEKNAPISLRAQSDAAVSQVPTNSLQEPTTDREESLATTRPKEAA